MDDKLKLKRLEEFLLNLGGLCDSPNSLRRHLAVACEEIYKQRVLEGTLNPFHQKRWQAFLLEDS